MTVKRLNTLYSIVNFSKTSRWNEKDIVKTYIESCVRSEFEKKTKRIGDAAWNEYQQVSSSSRPGPGSGPGPGPGPGPSPAPAPAPVSILSPSFYLLSQTEMRADLPLAASIELGSSSSKSAWGEYLGIKGLFSVLLADPLALCPRKI